MLYGAPKQPQHQLAKGSCCHFLPLLYRLIVENMYKHLKGKGIDNFDLFLKIDFLFKKVSDFFFANYMIV